MLYHTIFINAIQEKRILEITFTSKSKGTITRKCAPLDYGPLVRSGKVIPGDKYQVFDLNSPEGPHFLPINPDNLVLIHICEDHFNPAQIITWNYKWWIKRDWGRYS